jgi:hypothetical protein
MSWNLKASGTRPPLSLEVLAVPQGATCRHASAPGVLDPESPGQFLRLQNACRILDHADTSTTSRYLQASRLTRVAKRLQIAVIARCERWPISG